MLTRIVIAAVLIAFAAAASALALGLSDDPPAPGDLNAIQDRIDWDALERQGIYVVGTGQDAGCVHVSLLNPTKPNIAYIRARYGPDVCVDREHAAVKTSRYDVRALARVTAQCPRAGERVGADTEVAIAYTAILPGGFRHSFNPFGGYHRVPPKPCADGRAP